MQIASLQDLFIDELRDLYSAETQITKALPKMVQAATSQDLKEGFQYHLRQTENHIQRLEQIFNALSESPSGKFCKGMDGLLKEADEVVNSATDPWVRDAGLISQAQRVEHYEIAAYGTARTYAKELGNDDAADLLQETLDEEGETDKKLTKVAKSHVNQQAQRKAA